MSLSCPTQPRRITVATMVGFSLALSLPSGVTVDIVSWLQAAARSIARRWFSASPRDIARLATYGCGGAGGETA
ncbi:hypothetical protein V8D89_015054 [Ganoderma adspersum]